MFFIEEQVRQVPILNSSNRYKIWQLRRVEMSNCNAPLNTSVPTRYAFVLAIFIFLGDVSRLRLHMTSLPKSGKKNRKTKDQSCEWIEWSLFVLDVMQVAWIYMERSAILTVQNHVITRNPRISVTHDQHHTWNLHISSIQESDRGGYM